MSTAHVFLSLPVPPPAGIAEAGAPGLARLIARANFTPRPASEAAPLESRLFAHFDRPAEADALPVAALTAPQDGLDPADHPLRADPVCLRPDLVDVALLPGHPPGLSHAEAQALVEEVNARLGEGVLRLALGRSALRWYVASSSRLSVRALPPRTVAGRGTREHLPMGADRRRLLGWLTEVQFVLHASPVNAARAARGLPSVNSLWLWGAGSPLPAGASADVAGALPTHHADPPREAHQTRARAGGLFADCALARGLAHSAGIAAASILPLAALAGETGRLPQPLLVVDDPGPGTALDAAAAEKAWAAPLLAALRLGGVRRVVIDSPEGRHELGCLGLLRFWRRR